MESLNFTVICFLICVSTLLKVNSHVLSKEHLQRNLNSVLESNQLEPVNRDLNSENVNRVKKSPLPTANSPYTTTVCVQVRPDNATNQQFEDKQNLSQQTSSNSNNGMLNQHFMARVAQQKPSGLYQMNTFENLEPMPTYITPSRQRIQAPQVIQVPSSFLNNQVQQTMMQRNVKARNKEIGQSIHASTDYFNPQITDRQFAQMKPMLIQTGHQQDEMFQQSSLDKNARLMGHQYYRTNDIPDKEMGPAQYQIPSQVLPSSPLTVTKQYLLSSYPRNHITGEPAELITSNVPLTLNCDVSPDVSPKEVVKIAQYTTSKQNQAQRNFYPVGSIQEMKQMFPFPQDTYRRQQIEYVRSSINNPWLKGSRGVTADYVYKGEPILEQIDRPKVMMDEMGRSVVYWRDPSQMFTPIYNYGFNEERKSSGSDNQFPQNQEKVMNIPYEKQQIVAENSKDWVPAQPVRALTEEELQIKEKHIEEQLKESQARLQELQKQLKKTNINTYSKDSNESETEKTEKPNESSTAQPSSTTKTPPGSAKRSVSRQRSTKDQR